MPYRDRIVAFLAVIVLTVGCTTQPPKNVDRQKLLDSVGPALRASAEESETKQDFAAAIGFYRSLRVMYPDEIDLDVNISRMLRYDRQAEQALPIINGSLELHPHEAALLLEQGKIFIDLSRPSEAVDALEEAVTLTPENWEVYSTLGVAYDYQSEWTKAQENYQIGLGFSPDNPSLHNNLALSLAQSGDIEGAITVLEGALNRVDATPRMRQNLALLKALQGDMEGAAKLVKKDIPTGKAEQSVDFLRILSEQRRTLD